MGQQNHETHIAAALRRVGSSWDFIAAPVVPFRSRPGTGTRLPLGLVSRLPYLLAARVGRQAYGSPTLVHRFDLRCPPTTGTEILTIHDLAPLRFMDEGDLPLAARRGAQRAAMVICPSEFAAGEIASLLDVKRIAVIPNGVDSDVYTAETLSAQRLERMGLRTPFVLFAGGATDRKNTAALAEAWGRLAAALPEYRLVICGPHRERQMAIFGAHKRVDAVGYLPREQVIGLVKTAALVVVPSRYEGFGLPALEAMAAGTPVVAAASGALPEVCGDAAYLAEPTANGLYQGMLDVLTSESAQRDLREAGSVRARLFDWDSAARSTLDVYCTALSS